MTFRPRVAPHPRSNDPLQKQKKAFQSRLHCQLSYKRNLFPPRLFVMTQIGFQSWSARIEVILEGWVKQRHYFNLASQNPDVPGERVVPKNTGPRDQCLMFVVKEKQH